MQRNFGKKFPSNGTGIIFGTENGTELYMIYKITVNFPLSLDMKPGTSNPNKWYRIIIIIIIIIHFI